MCFISMLPTAALASTGTNAIDGTDSHSYVEPVAKELNPDGIIEENAFLPILQAAAPAATFGTLCGNVRDTEGHGIPGASIAVYCINDGIYLNFLETDENGYWQTADLDVLTGNIYRINVYKAGYVFASNDIVKTAADGENTVDVTGSAVTESVCKESDYTYRVTDSTVTITKYNGSDAEVIIPSKIEGYPVVSIGSNAFYGNTTVKTVIIPEFVNDISSYAFNGCTALETTMLPNRLSIIGSYAFRGCTSLTGIDIPDTVTKINTYAFSGCKSLETLGYPVCLSSVGNYAFSDCEKLKSVTVPEGVTTLPSNMFYGAQYKQ